MPEWCCVNCLEPMELRLAHIELLCPRCMAEVKRRCTRLPSPFRRKLHYGTETVKRLLAYLIPSSDSSAPAPSSTGS